MLGVFYMEFDFYEKYYTTIFGLKYDDADQDKITIIEDGIKMFRNVSKPSSIIEAENILDIISSPFPHDSVSFMVAQNHFLELEKEWQAETSVKFSEIKLAFQYLPLILENPDYKGLMTYINTWIDGIHKLK
jgi:hypothetical protein